MSARFAFNFFRQILFLGLWLAIMYVLLRFISLYLSKELSASVSKFKKNIPSDKHPNSSMAFTNSEIPGFESYPFTIKGRNKIEEFITIMEAAKTIRSIPYPPYILGELGNGRRFFRNSSCARFPTIYDIEFSNSYWQTLRTSNGTLHIFGAYYDVRTRNLLGPSVRILGMMDRIEPKVTTFCQLWFSGERDPVFSRVFEYKYLWASYWGNYIQGELQPYLLSCRIPDSHYGKVPISVSLAERPCAAANNNVRVQFKSPKVKKKFAVCVKGLDFLHEDLSVRLVEWIELLTLLGANKIFFYKFAVHPNISRVLQYYKSTGQVDVTPISLPGGQPNDPNLRHAFLKKKVYHKRQNELIPYNDCLYRNLYSYEYIALLDIDEVIMPKMGGGWAEMMDEIVRRSRLTSNEPWDSYNFRNVYFMDEMMRGRDSFSSVPKYFHILQNVYRSANYTQPRKYVKCFHNTERVITVHNHFPRECFDGKCKSYDVPTELAHLQHYRATCAIGIKDCNEDYGTKSVLDGSIWRFKERLIARATQTLKTLGFIPELDTPADSSTLEEHFTFLPIP